MFVLQKSTIIFFVCPFQKMCFRHFPLLAFIKGEVMTLFVCTGSHFSKVVNFCGLYKHFHDLNTIRCLDHFTTSPMRTRKSGLTQCVGFENV